MPSLPNLASIAELQPLREVLVRAGLTRRGMTAAIGAAGFQAIVSRDLVQVEWLTRSGRPIDTLIRLFFTQLEVAVEAAQDAVAPTHLETWLRLSLVEPTASGVRGLVEFNPQGELWLACDPLPPRDMPLPAEHVMGVAGTTATLDDFTIRRRIRRALDLGSGCGLQAIAAARHAEEVVAVDCNARAVRYTSFNAAFNGFPNVTALQGDYFAPVFGQKFDLIVSNPPFVISPDRDFVFRDSGEVGDTIVHEILTEAPDLLEEGGYCQVVGDWIEIAGQDWRSRLATWFQGSGCDALVLRFNQHDPASYAAHWLEQVQDRSPGEYTKRYAAWVDYYRSLSIATICHGLITLRRRSGANWVYCEDVPPHKKPPCGRYVERLFAAQDYLRSLPDPHSLLHERLCVHPDVELVQHCEPTAGSWQIVGAELRTTQGILAEFDLDPPTTALLPRLTGTRTLGEAIHDLSLGFHLPIDELTEPCLKKVIPLIFRGVIVKAD